MLIVNTVLDISLENPYQKRPVDLLKNWTNLMRKFDRFPK